MSAVKYLSALFLSHGVDIVSYAHTMPAALQRK